MGGTTVGLSFLKHDSHSKSGAPMAVNLSSRCPRQKACAHMQNTSCTCEFVARSHTDFESVGSVNSFVQQVPQGKASNLAVSQAIGANGFPTRHNTDFGTAFSTSF